MTTPAAGEGTSVSTLSVEISTRTSSTAIESPTFFAHRRMVPSVTVSPNWGMVTVVATVTRFLSVQASTRRRHQCFPDRLRKGRMGVNERCGLGGVGLPAHRVHQFVNQLGEQAWRESGLGAPADIDALNQKINHLEQHGVELRLQLAERDQDLAAARAANRELMAQLNTAARNR